MYLLTYLLTYYAVSARLALPSFVLSMHETAIIQAQITDFFV